MAKSSRDMWKDFVEGSKKPSRSALSRVGFKKKLVGTVMGIDPSLRATGVSVVTASDSGILSLVYSETIKTPASRDVYECLANIHRRIDGICDSHSIDHAAVEQTIYVQNFRTAMTLGTAKGAALGVLCSRNIPISEYAPLRIKQAVVGKGRASKTQVEAMVSNLLNYKKWGSSDETDAAGAALCHIFSASVV